MNQIKKQKLSEITKEWLIAKGYNPENLNQPGKNGDTALMTATREGVYGVVKELIDLGANINAKNNENNNALWFGCFGNHYELISLLLGAKINIDNQNDNGTTVLMYAASAGKTGVAKLLLQHKPNLNLRNLDDYRAIDFASNIEILRLLKNAET
ncbi:ankyrin repeat domain-containing protein [Umezakia ovalisporum]|jgi:ankyrin repeat protein|uniref:Ankyrin repeat domain-containing protein n=2 Tax=Umezakia ovalisporum TaxID=75695 RepID=A0AA43GXE2_9CYAN|nr:ankyrin repeat domain-containing protein [Umezakia ovalisporum]MBI1241561.1 ankyrin repeat domain-containing protein [Nostoc sp. RI_552]MDH6057631.1 ankyrin repeat domain-containing protein [Umezakia ovalisporum FSS-43]MDH6063514.1 ankyrin repeat domain-containing protein [Umezakia ovalisporum FSS-62]MDH6066039.1 ankyrin repeat domain-containing protein [Umezakia ovalisporum APH033B]MDH6072439.1 ankyrin repeat domain-containing protein [Umezakia ovalisporum CobakiLakeA]